MKKEENFTEVSEDLKEKIKETAEKLRERISKRPKREKIRTVIEENHIGEFLKADKLSESELDEIKLKGGIAGVDGSINSIGGVYPYLFYIKRALGLSSEKRHEEILLSEVDSPLLLDDLMDEEEYKALLKKGLAELEAKAAKEALERFNPKVLFLDGSLVRFKIEAKDYFEQIKNVALNKNVIVAGIVEGISTSLISSLIRELLPSVFKYSADWEILLGIMDMGEYLEVKPGLFKEGFRTFFMRSSIDPKPIGVDILEEQKEYSKFVANLVYTLTPENSRGIPLWMDIIDKRVKIRDPFMEMVAKSYLGEDFLEVLAPKREKRNP